MNHFKSFHLLFTSLFFLTTCHLNYFYPDPDDPGLSRFTSRGYNVASVYINDRPFKNNGLFYPLLQKDSTGNSIDTLKFKWNLYPNDSAFLISAYNNISFHIPVPASFNKNNLLAFDGQRFLNSIPVTLQDSSSKVMSGTATLYFVSVKEEKISDKNYIKLSGLFDGNIADSIRITNGRFDFEVSEETLNF